VLSLCSPCLCGEFFFYPENGNAPSYALVIYDADIHDQIVALDVDADFVVALPDNGRDDLREEIPKGGYRVFFD
jgi:hypothetical protein